MYMNKSYIENIIEEHTKLSYKGKIADYIPELSKVDINKLGLAFIGENTVFVGDYEYKFTIQSVSKILSLILNLEDYGYGTLKNKINFKPTMDSFNSMYRLDLLDKLPANPMINSGAILNTSLIKGDRITRMLELCKRLTGDTIDYNKDVYESEKFTGDKNKSIAYMLKSKNLIDDVEKTLDDYFKQCSIEMDLKQVCKIGYILSNKGFNEKNIKVLDSKLVKIINSVMMTSGMYNNSGEFAIEVGLPSKSGVSGVILSVIPNLGSLAVFSPGLDDYGNSYLGVKILKKISDKYSLSIF